MYIDVKDENVYKYYEEKLWISLKVNWKGFSSAYLFTVQESEYKILHKCLGFERYEKYCVVRYTHFSLWKKYMDIKNTQWILHTISNIKCTWNSNFHQFLSYSLSLYCFLFSFIFYFCSFLLFLIFTSFIPFFCHIVCLLLLSHFLFFFLLFPFFCCILLYLFFSFFSLFFCFVFSLSSSCFLYLFNHFLYQSHFLHLLSHI